MSTTPPILEQVVDRAEKTLQASISNGVDRILQEQQSAIRSAQGALGQIDDGLKEVVKKIESKEPRIWLFAMALVPTLATALLGLLVFHLQIKTNAAIDRASKQLSTRLALSQQFYEQRFTIYKDADRRMVQLLSAVNNLDRNPNDADMKKEAANSVVQLGFASRTNGFYMTPEVSQGLANVWSIATDLPQMVGAGTRQIDDLNNAIKRVEDEMRKELLVNIESIDEDSSGSSTPKH